MQLQRSIDIEQARNMVLRLSADKENELPIEEREYYALFTKAVKDIWAATANLDYSAEIVVAVMNQGYRLNKSVEWINKELLFEAQAICIGKRTEIMLSSIKRNQASDAALDLYNERLTRFN